MYRTVEAVIYALMSEAVLIPVWNSWRRRTSLFPSTYAGFLCRFIALWATWPTPRTLPRRPSSRPCSGRSSLKMAKRRRIGCRALPPIPPSISCGVAGAYLTASWMSPRLHARGRHAINAERGRDVRRRVILAYKRMTRKVAQKEGFHLRRIDVPVLEALLASFHRERSKVLAGERPKRRLPDSYYGAGLIYHSSATHYRC